MTEKTLVEIAVEFNIEINRLRNKINYEKRKGNMIGFKRDGVLFLNNDDVKTIKRLFDVVENPVEFNNEFDFFKTQLEEKDKQILTKQALDDKKELQIELAENQNKSFWQRLLKK